MLPGPRASHDSTADSPGWRVANALAIAAPYLLAACLFVTLYLELPGVATHAVPPPAPAADLSTPAESAVPAASAPAAGVPAHGSRPAPAPAALPVSSSHSAGESEPMPAQPVAVEAAIAETMKLPGDSLAYPAVARRANIQGGVVVSATIGADGAVQTVQPVSGPALLQAAALETVRSWRYRPWLVQGKAVPFTTQIIINYKLDAAPQ